MLLSRLVPVLLSRLVPVVRRLAILAITSIVVFYATTKVAFAAGLIQEDIASNPWVVAIIGVLGIGPVAVLVTALLDRAAASAGISTSALLWIVCLALAAVIGLVGGDLPAWSGDPDAFYEALVLLGIKYRVGAQVLHALFLQHLRLVQRLRAPKAASR